MLDTLFVIRLKNEEIKLAGKHMDYDDMYPAATLNLISLLESGLSTAKELEENNKFGLVICDELNDLEPISIIDFDNKEVYMKMLELEFAEDFLNNWGVEFVDKDGKVYIKWEEDVLEPLLNANEEIDKIYPLLDKEILTFDELKEYVDFLDWCSKQDSTTFEYCDSLIYHFDIN